MTSLILRNKDIVVHISYSFFLFVKFLKLHRNVWVSCVAEPDYVTVEYDGHMGFPSYFFPYVNQENYLSPLVAIRIGNLSGIYNVSIRLQYDRTGVFVTQRAIFLTCHSL